jgi:hypothetical protein
MVQVISSNAGAAAAYGSARPAFASLQAQLQRYEQQLSECINCASAKTPEGKADIEVISARIEQVKGRMTQADEAPKVSEATNVAHLPVANSTGLGGRIDVYA